MRDVLSGCGESNVSQKAAAANPHPAIGGLGEDVDVVEVPGDVVDGAELDVGGGSDVDVEVEVEVVGATLVLGDVVEDVEGATVVLVVDGGAVVVELVDDDVTSVVEELSAPQLPAGGGVYTVAVPTAISCSKHAGNRTASGDAGAAEMTAMPPATSPNTSAAAGTRPRRISCPP